MGDERDKAKNATDDAEPDVEAHKAKNAIDTPSDGDDDDTPDVEAHRKAL